MGAEIEEYDDSMLVRRTGSLSKVNIKTMPHPGFPTDMQPQMAVLMSLAEGTSIITEGVWDNRFRYIEELKRMGANIQVDGKIAVIEGVGGLNAAPVKATDLRAGAALMIGALAAKGVTEIEDIQHIERGYEHVDAKFRSLGAEFKRIYVPDGVSFQNAV
jgi:UDP-N-acetylglucosamine 1-carboxyvinyltransferase